MPPQRLGRRRWLVGHRRRARGPGPPRRAAAGQRRPRRAADGDERSSRPSRPRAALAVERVARRRRARSISPSTATAPALPIAAPQRLERARTAPPGSSCRCRRRARTPPASRATAPRAHRRRQRRGAARDLVERHAELERDRRSRRARSSRCAAPEQRHVEAPRPRPACDVARVVPSKPRSAIVGRAGRRRRADRRRSPRPGESRACAHHARVVGIDARARVAARRLSRISRLGVGDRIDASRRSPRCAAPTLVHTRTSGSASATSRAISPAWFMPSSTTATSGRRRSSSSESGSPMWLFRLPGVCGSTRVPRREHRRGRFLRRGLAGAAGDRDDRVRPTDAARARASACSAASVSSTRSATASLGRRLGAARATTSTPRGPRRALASTNACAVERVAAERDEQRRPRRPSRVDRDARRTLCRGDRRPRRPPIAAATSPASATIGAPAATSPHALPRRRRASASRATSHVVERQRRDRRSPGTSRAPCRRRSRGRPGVGRRRSPASIARGDRRCARPPALAPAPAGCRLDRPRRCRA